MKIPFIISFFALGSLGYAQTLYSFSGAKGGNAVSPSFSAVEGDQFTVGSTNLYITQLGHEADFLTYGARSVAVWDYSTGAVLGQTSISASDTLDAGYRYKVVSAIALLAGHSYVIGGLHGSGVSGTYLHNTSTALLGSGVLDNGTVYNATSVIGPNTSWGGSGPRHYVANAKLSTVPEPVSMAALGLGLLGTLGRRRKKS